MNSLDNRLRAQGLFWQLSVPGLTLLILLTSQLNFAQASDEALGSGEHYFQAHFAAMAEIRSYDVVYSGFYNSSSHTGQSLFLEIQGRVAASVKEDLIVGLKKYVRHTESEQTQGSGGKSNQETSKLEVFCGRLVGKEFVHRSFPGPWMRATFAEDASPYRFHSLTAMPTFPLFGWVNFPFFSGPAGETEKKMVAQLTNPSKNQKLIRETADEAVVQIEIEKPDQPKRRLVYYFDTETMLIVRKRVFLLEDNSWNPIFKGEFTYKNHDGLFVPESMRTVYFEIEGGEEIVTQHAEILYEWKQLDSNRVKQWRLVDIGRIENLGRLVRGEDIADVAGAVADTQ